MKAQTIIDLLRNKHFEDIGFSECKTGGSWGGSPARLDYWAMKPSWAKWTTWGYEVKVSRSDFLRDDKWRGYLDYCHEFYFVAPPGVIERDEVPEEAGLIVTSKNGTRLYTKKKAPSRPDINKDILIYALMWRTNKVSRRATAEEWERWLEEAKTWKDIGHRASQRLAKLAAEAHRVTVGERHRHEREMEKYADLAKWLADQGLSIHDFRLKTTLRDRLTGEETKAALESIGKTQAALDALEMRLRP